MSEQQKPYQKVWRPTGEVEYFLGGSANVWEDVTADD